MHKQDRQVCTHTSEGVSQNIPEPRRQLRRRRPILPHVDTTVQLRVQAPQVQPRHAREGNGQRRRSEIDQEGGQIPWGGIVEVGRPDWSCNQ